MLLVRTSVGPSPIHGLGCFSDEPIRQGQRVWQLDPAMDREFDAAALSALPEALRLLLRRYGYTQLRQGRRVVILCGDNARYMNHSSHPNLLEAGAANELNLAARDIGAGEELTCDYRQFDLDAGLRLAQPWGDTA